MPNWKKDPPKSGDQPALRLTRTPSPGNLIAIVLSDDLIGCDTHFWSGRTMPCEAPECAACREGVPFRWHGYLGCCDPQTRSLFIFEMTARSAEYFKDYRKGYGSLRGAKFRASRWKKTPNSRVVIEIKPSDVPPDSLPTAPDVCAAMSIIWELPKPDVMLAGQLKNVDRVRIAPGSNNRKEQP